VVVQQVWVEFPWQGGLPTAYPLTT